MKISWSCSSSARAKIDDYDDFVFLVLYGAVADDDRLVEVHCFYSERCLVTVHRDDCPAFAEIRERYEKRKATIERPSLLLYKLIDGLVSAVRVTSAGISPA